MEFMQKNRAKLPLFITIVLSLILGWWISDIPIGYYQFKQVCEKEGGLRVYGKVEPNVGWVALSEPEARAIASSYSKVDFVRYRTDDGTWKDVKYKGGNPWWSSSYEIVAKDETKKTRYRLEDKVESVINQVRLTRYVKTLIDESSNKPLITYTRFTFTWTNPNSTLLGRSDSAYCMTSIDEVESIRAILNTQE